MNKRDKQLLVIIIALVMMLLVVIAGVIIYLNSDSNEKDDSGNKQIKDILVNDNNDEEALTEGIEIDTVAGVLLFSKKYGEYADIKKIDGKDYTEIKISAKFPSKTVSVFDFNIGKSGEDFVYLGKCFGQDGKNYGIYVRTYEPESSGNWTEEENRLLCMMQEEINQFIWQLDYIYEDIPEENVDQKEQIIKTDYVDFVYTNSWKEEVEIVNSNDVVEFWANVANQEKIHLFDITFNGSGDILGEIVSTSKGKAEVGIVIYDIYSESVSDEIDIDKILAMQESVNTIIENIYQNENFTPKY